MISLRLFQAGLISCVGFLLSLAVFFPGFMSTDSIYQYSQAISGNFSDWHPPLMAMWWRSLLVLSNGPLPMLVWQQGLLWGSLFSLAVTFKDKKFSFLVPLLGFLPFIYNFSGVIWKDVEMGLSWLFSVSIFMFINKQQVPSIWRRLLIVVAFALLFYGAAVRANAFFGLPPLIYLALTSIKSSTDFKKLIFLSILGTILTIGSVSILNGSVTRSKPITYMFFDDLNAYYRSTGINLFPLTLELPDAAIDACSTQTFGTFFCFQEQGWKPSSFNISSFSADNVPSIKDQWKSLVIHHPAIYLKNRFSMFFTLLRSPSEEPYYIWQQGVDLNVYNISQPDALKTLSNITFIYVNSIRNELPFLFKPYFWLMLNFFMLGVSLKIKSFQQQESILLSFSSLMYIVGYIPITAQADFRYVYWSVIASCIAILILLFNKPSATLNLTS